MATITHEHPFRGLPLPIIRLVCRQGRLELLLRTPDGGRRFVPLEWTDAVTAGPALPSHSGLTSLAGLRPLRTIVDALLQRLPAAEEKLDAQNPADSKAAQAGLLPAAQSRRDGLRTAQGVHSDRRTGHAGEADGTPRDREQRGLRA